MTSIAITGVAGRMGARLIALAAADGNFQIVGAIERPDHPQQGQDAGISAGVKSLGVPITFDLRGTPQVLIDFSSPASTRHWLKTCRDRHIAMLIGTTGLQSPDFASIDQAARDIPILQSPNMSLGMNVLIKLAADAARMLSGYDAEIVESHHRHKKDAPSGSAIALADAVAQATGKPREGLPVHSLRLGDDVGRHTAYLAGGGERLELTHVATDRDTFAHGALRAAAWLAMRPPGRYSVTDMLGI